MHRLQLQISGPADNVTQFMSALKQAGINGFRSAGLYPDNEEESAKGWVAVDTGLSAEETFENVRSQTLAKVDELCKENGFTVRSQTSVIHSDIAGYRSYKLTVPLLSPDAIIMFQSASADVLWNQLKRMARVPQSSTKLAELSSEHSGLAEDFAAYIDQARTYYDASQAASGTSAALSLYYSLLNLAKAELLLWRPDLILRSKIHHGISAHVFSGEFSDWMVSVQREGVFPLLYEKRLGVSSNILGGSVAAYELFSRCPESSLEFSQLDVGERKVVPAFFSVLHDGSYSWANILVNEHHLLTTNAPTDRLLRDQFYFVSPQHVNIREEFAISSRFSTQTAIILRAKMGNFIRVADGFVQADLGVRDWTSTLLHNLRPTLGPPQEFFDASLSVSLSDSEMVGLPADLARYMAVFLVSNLVRYKPSSLDVGQYPAQVWYLDAFTRAAGYLAIESGINRILDRPVVFAGHFRA